jgi:hypothetical protein
VKTNGCKPVASEIVENTERLHKFLVTLSDKKTIEISEYVKRK